MNEAGQSTPSDANDERSRSRKRRRRLGGGAVAAAVATAIALSPSGERGERPARTLKADISRLAEPPAPSTSSERPAMPTPHQPSSHAQSIPRSLDNETGSRNEATNNEAVNRKIGLFAKQLASKISELEAKPDWTVANSSLANGGISRSVVGAAKTADGRRGAFGLIVTSDGGHNDEFDPDRVRSIVISTSINDGGESKIPEPGDENLLHLLQLNKNGDEWDVYTEWNEDGNTHVAIHDPSGPSTPDGGIWKLSPEGLNDVTNQAMGVYDAAIQDGIVGIVPTEP